MNGREVVRPQPITPERIQAEFPEATHNMRAVAVLGQRLTDTNPLGRPPHPDTLNGYLLCMAVVQHPGISLRLVLQAYKARINPKKAAHIAKFSKMFITMWDEEIREGLALSRDFQQEEIDKQNSMPPVKKYTRIPGESARERYNRLVEELEAQGQAINNEQIAKMLRISDTRARQLNKERDGKITGQS